MTWKAYVPTHISTFSNAKGFVLNQPVTQVVAYPPETHPDRCPIIESMTAVCVRTNSGERWFGVDKAYIDGSLRMVVERKQNNDKVLDLWESVPERK